MNFQIPPDCESYFPELLKSLGQPDTEDNRAKIIETVFAVGLASMQFSIGIAGGLKEVFKVDEEKIQAPTPKVCPKCHTIPTYNLGKWICNCTKWFIGPEPDTVCKRCNKPVKPNHYFWECGCNRYDRGPETLLVSVFPLT